MKLSLVSNGTLIENDSPWSGLITPRSLLEKIPLLMRDPDEIT